MDNYYCCKIMHQHAWWTFNIQNHETMSLFKNGQLHVCLHVHMNTNLCMHSISVWRGPLKDQAAKSFLNFINSTGLQAAMKWIPFPITESLKRLT